MGDGDVAEVWVPIEGAPTILNPYMKELGVSDDLSLHDIPSLEEELFCLVPEPVNAIMMVAPLNEKMMEDRNEFNKKVAAKEVGEVPSAFFVKQVIRNACGTIGLIHACCNSNIELKKGSMMEKLKSGHFKSSDAERGLALCAVDWRDVHKKRAEIGAKVQTEQDLELHYVVYVVLDGQLVELDGRKDAPCPIEECSHEDLLKKTCAYFKKKAAEADGDIRFSLLALCTAPEGSLLD
eukprot:TRINITY_DN5146_c0_g1_i1.p1 TRINITY_DN5146_c0_g1~~TRINITY_DN5146_c0_g1_i1.p1  ORF type:complete len:237 (+),score=54.92 TRINITY_DN5146_c0_g1_i1:68-778(+)